MPAAVQSTLAVTLGDTLGLVTAAVTAGPAAAAVPVAGEGTEALTWETGGVYKHVAKLLLKHKDDRYTAFTKAVNILTRTCEAF